jgi:hypothetical protein
LIKGDLLVRVTGQGATDQKVTGQRATFGFGFGSGLGVVVVDCSATRCTICKPFCTLF